MPRKQSDVEKSLEHKGFLRGKGDHNFFHYHTKAEKNSLVNGGHGRNCICVAFQILQAIFKNEYAAKMHIGECDNYRT